LNLRPQLTLRQVDSGGEESVAQALEADLSPDSGRDRVPGGLWFGVGIAVNDIPTHHADCRRDVHLYACARWRLAARGCDAIICSQAAMSRPNRRPADGPANDRCG